MNCIEEAISETELSDQDHTKQHHHLNHQNPTKLNHQHHASINHQINTIQHRQDHNMLDKHVNETLNNKEKNDRQNHIKQYKQDYKMSQNNDHMSPQHKDHATKQQQENIIIEEIDQYPETKVKFNEFLEESEIFETVEVDMGNELQIGEDSPQYENRHDDKNNDLISVGSSDSELGENINNQNNEFDDVNIFSFF